MADRALQVGDYVLATKFSDGDPQDQWCVGFYAGVLEGYAQPRHHIVDGEGKPFRGNGFRRAKRISHELGQCLLARASEIGQSGRSVWGWARVRMGDGNG
jgi:hypothetical protein